MVLIVVNPIFKTGQIVSTRGVFDLAGENPDFSKFIQDSLSRHVKGDWGDMSAEDKTQNDFSIKNGFRLFSAYEKEGLPKIWIITEADRSVTTILFPDEY
jgi:hypothetical protein